MFTGLIEEIGEILQIRRGEKSSEITIKAKKILQGSNIGDSISTNGVCLTISRLTSNGFQADVMAETLRKTDLSNISLGDKVNLERALSLNGRLGGHIVTGHIDGTGEIISLKREDTAVWVTIKPEEKLLRYMIEKGSIAIDGISLTIAYIDRNVFKVSIIPHTGVETILLNKTVGEVVNLECDVLGKYIEKLLVIKSEDGEKNSKIDMNFLKENGF